MKQKAARWQQRRSGAVSAATKPRAKAPLTLTAIERLIREAEADVAELKAQQTELVAEAAAEVEAQAERQRKEAALRELQKLEAETKEKTKALRSELGLN
ncbi:MAG: hypothetical protein U0745_05135 [Polyangia bacterium]